jgi:hypothetical protein
MRFYPDPLPDRARAITRDVFVVGALVLLALIGLKVHDAVDKLAVIPQGVDSAGSAVQGGFRDAADAVDSVPVVGGDLADGLRKAGGSTGGNVAELGKEGEDRVHRLANLLGALMFGIPAALLLVTTLPPRIEEIRRLTNASRVLHGAEKRYVAMRAAFSLPYEQLLPYTRDPFGDLAAERYDALVAAALDDAGLRTLRRR